MMLRLILIILLCFAPITAIPMTMYNNAWFDSINGSSILMSLSSIATLNACACQCYNNSLCITGTFIGINQTCILFSAYLGQGQLRLIINKYATVFSFSNRTINIGKLKKRFHLNMTHAE
jgi:hypothetical protein